MKEFLKNKLVIVTAVILLAVLLILAILEIGAQISAEWQAWLPDYEKKDISEILIKDELTDSDYEILFQQTGLTKLGIDGLVENNQKYKILQIQNQYFEKQEYKFTYFGPFTGYMKRSSVPIIAKYAVLENGDILYSPSTFFSFVRLGHSSLVIDAKRGSMAQASGYGTPVMLLHTSAFFVRPSFVILRVSADEETRNSVASYAKEKLIDADYNLLAGIFGDKAPETVSGTHCSHLIWYSYNKFGIDLDSNGGKIVTPDQILYSPYVSVVQVYGIDPASLPAAAVN